MTKEDAIQAMLDGKKATHKNFYRDEHTEIHSSGEYLFVFNDGIVFSCNEYEFWKHRTSESWEEDWEIFEEKQK